MYNAPLRDITRHGEDKSFTIEVLKFSWRIHNQMCQIRYASISFYQHYCVFIATCRDKYPICDIFHSANTKLPIKTLDRAAAKFPDLHETIRHRRCSKHHITTNLNTGFLLPKSDIMMNVSHRKPADIRICRQLPKR